MKYTALLFVWILGLGNVARSQSVLQDVVNKFVAFSEFENASVGIYAVDVNSKQVLIDHDGLRLLNPASTTKLFSTALALELLGGDYSPKTTFYYNGTIDNSILNGDLWIVGGGDMSLGSKYFDKDNRQKFLKEWTMLLQSKGINGINGTIYVDASDFGYEGVPDDWLWGDIGNYYGAHFSGVMVYDNLLEYHFKTNAQGKPAELIYTVPQVDSLKFTSNIISSTKPGDNSYIFGAPYSYIREGRGTLPQHNNDFTVKGSLPNPELQLGVEFSRALSESGFKHSGNIISTREKQIKRPIETWLKLFDYNGKTVREIAKVTNFESINVFAEGLMRLTAYEKSGSGTNEDGSSYMQAYWRGKLNTKALFLNDGSGLARTNAINSKTMCELLVYMNTSKSIADFYESLPVSGVSGTLKGVAKNQPAHGKVHAKSGTMRRTKSYAGYVETDSGKRIAFSFIVNNYTCSNKEIVQQMELLMNALVKE